LTMYPVINSNTVIIMDERSICVIMDILNVHSWLIKPQNINARPPQIIMEK